MRLMHCRKARASMLVTPLPKVTVARLLQPRNASEPIDVTPSGIAMVESPVQFLKASKSIRVARSPIATPTNVFAVSQVVEVRVAVVDVEVDPSE